MVLVFVIGATTQYIYCNDDDYDDDDDDQRSFPRRVSILHMIIKYPLY